MQAAVPPWPQAKWPSAVEGWPQARPKRVALKGRANSEPRNLAP
ncbi:hypothetical protein SGRA_4061 [Saprospira grandis str. Lewin]|uniref:Uncharacterized protein n=1 Tax=Saprospira grandis (strain Lewin) TaxID=984262 RepID=H6L7A4_SAPGL|nr:hypothetical protein SGRA_4061 [Saprospira grandis str. Lewin]